jgi:hypothetical protein
METSLPRDVEIIHARWERALERRGTDAVRLLLRVCAGHDSEIGLRGLMSEPPYPPISFVVEWLTRQESSDGKIGRRLLWPVLLLIVAVAVIVAAISTGDVELPKIGWL